MNEKRIKGLFVYPGDMNKLAAEGTGVYKKINMQLNEFRKHFETEFIEAYYKRNSFRKILSRLPLFPNEFWMRAKDVPLDTDFVYFRHEFGDIQINRFFKKIKQQNPKCRTIVEFPCYPLNLDVLVKKPSMLPFKFKHIISMRTLYKNVDCFVVFDKNENLYGRYTIQTSNGIDCESFRKRTVRPYNGEINIISVSHMLRWHRIDRIITGTAQYYKNGGKRKLHLHLVGDGPEYQNLLQLVKELNMEQYITFYEVLRGEKLDEVYDLCDIGLEVLSDEWNFSNSLKSKEYLGKGLPFISACDLPDEMQKISDFILRVPAEDKPISLEDVIDFYDAVYGANDLNTRQHVAAELRSFAENTYDMSVCMKPVVDYITGKENEYYR